MLEEAGIPLEPSNVPEVDDDEDDSSDEMSYRAFVETVEGIREQVWMQTLPPGLAAAPPTGLPPQEALGFPPLISENFPTKNLIEMVSKIEQVHNPPSHSFETT